MGKLKGLTRFFDFVNRFFSRKKKNDSASCDNLTDIPDDKKSIKPKEKTKDVKEDVNLDDIAPTKTLESINILKSRINIRPKKGNTNKRTSALTITPDIEKFRENGLDLSMDSLSEEEIIEERKEKKEPPKPHKAAILPPTSKKPLVGIVDNDVEATVITTKLPSTYPPPNNTTQATTLTTTTTTDSTTITTTAVVENHKIDVDVGPNSNLNNADRKENVEKRKYSSNDEKHIPLKKEKSIEKNVNKEGNDDEDGDDVENKIKNNVPSTPIHKEEFVVINKNDIPCNESGQRDFKNGHSKDDGSEDGDNISPLKESPKNDEEMDENYMNVHIDTDKEHLKLKKSQESMSSSHENLKKKVTSSTSSSTEDVFKSETSSKNGDENINEDYEKLIKSDHKPALSSLSFGKTPMPTPRSVKQSNKLKSSDDDESTMNISMEQTKNEAHEYTDLDKSASPKSSGKSSPCISTHDNRNNSSDIENNSGNKPILSPAAVMTAKKTKASTHSSNSSSGISADMEDVHKVNSDKSTPSSLKSPSISTTSSQPTTTTVTTTVTTGLKLAVTISAKTVPLSASTSAPLPTSTATEVAEVDARTTTTSPATGTNKKSQPVPSSRSLLASSSDVNKSNEKIDDYDDVAVIDVVVDDDDVVENHNNELNKDSTTEIIKKRNDIDKINNNNDNKDDNNNITDNNKIVESNLSSNKDKKKQEIKENDDKDNAIKTKTPVNVPTVKSNIGKFQMKSADAASLKFQNLNIFTAVATTTTATTTSNNETLGKPSTKVIDVTNSFSKKLPTPARKPGKSEFPGKELENNKNVDEDSGKKPVVKQYSESDETKIDNLETQKKKPLLSEADSESKSGKAPPTPLKPKPKK